MFDAASFALGRATGGGDGGQNPNYVETIDGTLLMPWGGKFGEIIGGLAAGQLSAYIEVTTSPGPVSLSSGVYPLAFGYREDTMANNDTLIFSGSYAPLFAQGDDFLEDFVEDVANVSIVYGIDGGTFLGACQYDGPRRFVIYQEEGGGYGTKLTIIHHPLD